MSSQPSRPCWARPIRSATSPRRTTTGSTAWPRHVAAACERVVGRLAAVKSWTARRRLLPLPREVGELICEPHDMRARSASGGHARGAARDHSALWVGNPPETGSDRFEAPPRSMPPPSQRSWARGVAGIVRGPAASSRQGDFERVQPGDIIVCRRRTVMGAALLGCRWPDHQYGRCLSHAAVVAREFGLPAVVGTHDATVASPTGERWRSTAPQGSSVCCDRAAGGLASAGAHRLLNRWSGRGLWCHPGAAQLDHAGGGSASVWRS